MPGPAVSFTRARMGGQYKTGRTGRSGRTGPSRPSHLVSKYRLPHRLHLDRADFELGDLRVGIEPGVGKQVGRGLTEMKRYEDLMSGLALGQSGSDQHGTTARGHPNRISFFDAELEGVSGIDIHYRDRFPGIETGGAAGHG